MTKPKPRKKKSKKELDYGDIVEVIWADAEICTGEKTSAMVASDPCLCRSWGKFTGENKTYMILTHNLFGVDSGHNDSTRIPIRCIQETIILRKEPSDEYVVEES